MGHNEAPREIGKPWLVSDRVNLQPWSACDGEWPFGYPGLWQVRLRGVYLFTLMLLILLDSSYRIVSKMEVEVIGENGLVLTSSGG
jgi:hypothetical protein